MVFAATLALPQAMSGIMTAAIAVGVGTGPLIPGLLPDSLETGAKLSMQTVSAVHRILIWKITAHHIKNRPVGGAGLDTSRAFCGRKERVQIRYPGTIIGKPVTTNYEPIPLHPHNGVLQVWLELGMVGAAILLGLFLALLHAIATQVVAVVDRTAAFAMLTVTMTIRSISFGAWQGWWVTAILLTSTFLVVQVNQPNHCAAQD